MTLAKRPGSPDLSRRDFVKNLGTLAASAPWIGRGRPSGSDESAVARFYRSLTPDQKSRICFPIDHPLRLRVRPNWAIVEPRIADLNAEQQSLCVEVFNNLCSEDGRARFLRVMGDDYGGFANYHVAVFGSPESGLPCEWVITGRHVTLRTDGLSITGPILYGHAARGLAKGAVNVWRSQAELAGRLFFTLDEGQRTKAIATGGVRSGAAGLSVGALDGPQKAIVQGLVGELLNPFRPLEFVGGRVHPVATGFIEALDFACTPDRTPGAESHVGAWRLEGPGLSWYYHDSPHVHAWLKVGPLNPSA